MKCPTCKKTLKVGDWPFCPHGQTKLAVVPDEVPGGFVVENGFDQPTRFYSHSEHERALAARGLEIRAKWAGPNDKHLTRWDAPSQKTLDDARVLVSRTKADRWKGADTPITRETTGETFTA